MWLVLMALLAWWYGSCWWCGRCVAKVVWVVWLMRGGLIGVGDMRFVWFGLVCVRDMCGVCGVCGAGGVGATCSSLASSHLELTSPSRTMLPSPHPSSHSLRRAY